MFASLQRESAPGLWGSQSIWSRIKDAFTSPMTGDEFEIAAVVFPRELRLYHRGIISARELARIVRYSDR